MPGKSDIMHASEIEARWTTFLEENADIGALALNWPEQRSLITSFREIFNFDQDFAETLLVNPSLTLRCGGNALRKFAKKKIIR